MRHGVMRCVTATVLVASVLLGGSILSGGMRAEGAAVQVFYHDQSGTRQSGVDAGQAAAMASTRLGFPVHVPSLGLQGSQLRALWVMDRHTPRFVVLYYGGGDGYITCQLHESLNATAVALNWAPQTAVTIGHARGTMLQTIIGGANPVVELIWRAHGVRYDLLGSTSTPLATLMTMAVSLS